MLLLSLLIGLLAGLRTFTPLAAMAWGAYLGVLPLEGALALVGSVPAVAIFTVLALAELAADKWPKLPKRTSTPGIVARILSGALAGACIAAPGGAVWLGAALGAAGGVAGAYAGFHARRGIVRGLRAPDYAIAVLEDIIAVAGSVWVVWQ